MHIIEDRKEGDVTQYTRFVRHGYHPSSTLAVTDADKRYLPSEIEGRSDNSQYGEVDKVVEARKHTPFKWTLHPHQPGSNSRDPISGTCVLHLQAFLGWGRAMPLIPRCRPFHPASHGTLSDGNISIMRLEPSLLAASVSLLRSQVLR